MIQQSAVIQLTGVQSNLLQYFYGYCIYQCALNFEWVLTEFSEKPENWRLKIWRLRLEDSQYDVKTDDLNIAYL